MEEKMNERILVLLHNAVSMLIDEEIMLVDIIDGLGTSESEMIELGFDNLF